jgi:hypothetical protein
MQESVLSKLTGQSTVVLDIGSKLSLLWIFFTFNAAYGDIGTLYYSLFINPTPVVHYTQAFLLGGAALVEVSMVMIVLSRILKQRVNRLANIVAGVILTAVQAISLFVGTPTLGYSFISAMMIVAGVVIAWLAWKWQGVSEVRTSKITSWKP